MSNILIFAVITGAFFFLIFVSVLPNNFRGVIFRLGRVNRVVGPGLVVSMPFIESMMRVDLRPIIMDLQPEEVVTNDQSRYQINASIHYCIEDPIKVTTALNYPDPAKDSIANIHFFASTLQASSQQTVKKLSATPDLSNDRKSWSRLEQLIKKHVQETFIDCGVRIESVKVEVCNDVKS